MADVVEVIHKIDYEVNYTGLNKASLAISQQLKELEHLNNVVKDYKQQLNTTTDVKSFEAISVKISAVTKQVEKQASKLQGALSQIGKGVAGGLGIPTSLDKLVEKGVEIVKEYVQEASRLADETARVKVGFDQLNDPVLLGELRSATKGVVSDLELMKQAVKYENVGLPMDQLTTALGFANQRALATGESVDELVDSLVKGIGNESLDALKRLGINVENVQTEFQRTGNFAASAFKVIRDDADKTTGQIDTLAKQQAQYTATIVNQQAEFGKTINKWAAQLKAELLDLEEMGIWDFLTSGGGKNRKELDKAIAEKEKRDRFKAGNDAVVADVYGRYYKNFANNYANADKNERAAIRLDAQEKYNDRAANPDTRNGNAGIQTYLSANEQAFKQLIRYLDEQDKKSDKQIEKPSDVPKYSGNCCCDGENKSGNSNKGDSEEDMPAGDMQSMAVRDADYTSTDKPSDVKFNTVTVNEFKLPRTSLKTQREDYIASLKSARDESKANLGNAKDALRDAKDNGAPDDEIKELKSKVKEARRILKEDRSALREEQGDNLKQYIDGYKQITQAAVDAYNTITDAQIRALDKEIEIRQKRVDAATKLAERGNTEALRIEEERLNKAQKKREEIARKQMIVNAALAISNAIAGIAETATTGPGAIVLIPAVIAAIVAGYAAVTAVTKESTEQAFADGVVGYKGKGGPRDDMNRVWISSGESVITAAGTAKNRELLEAINKGAHFSMLAPQLNPTYQMNATVAGGYASRGEMNTLEKKMDTLIDAVSANGTTVHANVDERGLSLMTVKQIRRDQNRFR